MSAQHLIRPLLLTLALAGLAGCGGFKEQLGLTKQSPDEFRVVARAPLSMPPDFNLVPPSPGSPRPQEGTPTDQARTAVFGGTPGAQPLGSPGLDDQAFLDAAGAGNADPSIRQVVDAETRQINSESTSFIDSLIFWRSPEAPGTVVDPAAEQARIRENQALGRPVTEGDTPTIERREKGILEGIF